MGEQCSVYLLYGSERFLIEEMREKLIQSHIEPMDVNVYDMNEIPVDYAIEDAETMPFLSDKRVVIIKNPFFLTGEKQSPSAAVEHNLKKLEQYLENPSPFAVVIFEAPYKKLDDRKKIVKALKRTAKVFEANPLQEKSIPQWIHNECLALNITIDDDAIDQLYSLIGNDLRKLKTEIEKLSLYVGDDGKITVDVVDLLVTRSLEDNIFALVDHVVNKRMNEAFHALFDLFDQKEEPIKIVLLLARQFRLIAQIHSLRAKGKSVKQMAAYLKLHPFVVQKIISQSQKFSQDECYQMIQILAETDYFMKTGKFDKMFLLELMLTKIA